MSVVYSRRLAINRLCKEGDDPDGGVVRMFVKSTVKSVLIRVDADSEIGTGHVMRCEALAHRLICRSFQITFACASLPDSLEKRLRGIGARIIRLPPMHDWRSDLYAIRYASPAMVDLLIVDHYRLDRRWEQSMRSRARRILVIDDLADRDHDCDLLLDQNLHHNAYLRYLSRVQPETRLLLGPRYAILRGEFYDPRLFRRRDGGMKRLLVFFGGADPGNQSLKVIEAIRMFGDAPFETTIVLGPTHPDPDSVMRAATGLKELTLLGATCEMGLLMSQADLALGTCGIAAWERCALGLPSFVTITADNQREDARLLDSLGAVICLGEANSVGPLDWFKVLRHAWEGAIDLASMTRASTEVMAGWREAAIELDRSLCDAMG